MGIGRTYDDEEDGVMGGNGKLYSRMSRALGLMIFYTF